MNCTEADDRRREGSRSAGISLAWWRSRAGLRRSTGVGPGARPENCSRLFEDDQLVDIVDGVGLRLTIGPDDLEGHVAMALRCSDEHF